MDSREGRAFGKSHERVDEVLNSVYCRTKDNIICTPTRAKTGLGTGSEYTQRSTAAAIGSQPLENTNRTDHTPHFSSPSGHFFGAKLSTF